MPLFAGMKAVLDAMDYNIAILDKEGTILYTNTAWNEFAVMNGHPHPKRFAGINYLTVCDTAAGRYSEEASEAANGIREVIRGERKRFLLEYSCFTNDNPEQWFNLHACKFELGESVLYFAAHENITHIKHNEAALRETEKKYNLLDENVTDMISVHDKDGRYSFVSHSVKPMLGYTPEEMIGKSAYDFFHPDDLPAVSRSHRAIIETPHVSTVSYRIRKKDGPYLWVETTSKVVSDSTTGEIAQVIAVTRDITERKKAEELLNEHQNSLEKTVRERTAELQKANSTLKDEVLERVKAQSERKKSEQLFKMLIENIPVATYIKDAEGRYVEVNAHYTKISGYSYDEVIGKTDFELYTEEVAREFRGKRFTGGGGKPAHHLRRAFFIKRP